MKQEAVLTANLSVDHESLHTLPQAAKALGIPVYTLRRAAKAGSFPVHYVFNQRPRVFLSEVKAAIASFSNGGC